MGKRKRGSRGGRGRNGGGQQLSPAQLAAGHVPADGATTKKLYEQSVGYLQSVSGFDGANRDPGRGFLYWPSLDSKRELDSYTRRELMVKSRWLRANMGLPNRLCSGLADFIGYLTPVWDSGDEAWDREVEEHYMDRAMSAGAVDAAGAFAMPQMQIELNKAAFGDGDVLPVVLQREGSGSVVLGVYQSPQVVSPKEKTEKEGWFDGVKINRHRKHLAYGLMQESGKVRTISARDALYYSHPDDLGRVRPPTILARAINHLVDVTEIIADWKLAIKVAAQVGIYMSNQALSGAQWGGQAIFSDLRDERVRPPATDETEDGGGEAPATDGSEDKTVAIEDIYRPGAGVLNLPAGSDLKTLQDERPHPNAMGLVAHMIRDVAWGVGASPELMWDISGLRGANNRWANADLGRWIACRLLRQRAWMKRWLAVWVVHEMKAGRIGEPAGGKFWRVGFVPQASLTADKGRDGKLNIALVEAKLRSLRTHFGEEGLHWIREIKQMKREEAELKEIFGAAKAAEKG